jgi:signal transduction histidine kinase
MSQWSERIVVATGTMKTIIQELVDVARLQMGQALQLDLRRTDLISLARRLVGEHQAAGRHIRLETSCTELLGRWDETRLSRVLANLLDNAVKYSPQGADVDVDVALIQRGGAEHALVRVRDRGRGIPPEDVARVFERFYRASNVDGSTGGSGLGLAVAHQIVAQHGGAIEIDSQPGVGTVVTLRLPRTGPTEHAAQ